MGEVAQLAAIEPDEWFVVFHPSSPSRWISFLAFGHFKHVSAFAYYPGFKAWLLYDPQWTGTRLVLIAHEAAKGVFAGFTDGCTIVKMKRNPTAMPLFTRLGFYCVPAIKHLLSVRCAKIRPDAFYRHILRHHGGILIDGRRRQCDSPSTDSS